MRASTLQNNYGEGAVNSWNHVIQAILTALFVSLAFAWLAAIPQNAFAGQDSGTMDTVQSHGVVMHTDQPGTLLVHLPFRPQQCTYCHVNDDVAEKVRSGQDKDFYIDGPPSVYFPIDAVINNGMNVVVRYPVSKRLEGMSLSLAANAR